MAATDLSLHISPPSPPDAGSSGGHETQGFFAKPKLCLGLETATATEQDGQCDLQLQQRLHQPSQIQRFKKSSSSSAALSGGTTTRSGNNGSGGGGKRSSRAPRMRWTTALHAHFVHAVELLGGHESTFKKLVLVSIFTSCSVGLYYCSSIDCALFGLLMFLITWCGAQKLFYYIIGNVLILLFHLDDLPLDVYLISTTALESWVNRSIFFSLIDSSFCL